MGQTSSKFFPVSTNKIKMNMTKRLSPLENVGAKAISKDQDLQYDHLNDKL
jgi:hypothetical protein